MDTLTIIDFFGYVSMPMLTPLFWFEISKFVLFCLVISLLLYYYLRYRRQQWLKQISKNKVCVHIVGRGKWTPSISPFALKLETFLLMNKIPYKSVVSSVMSSKNKTPWISYQGQDVADSQFCIEFLKREKDLQVDAHLTPQQKSVARAWRCLVEENLYWTMCYESFVKNPEILNVLLKDIFSPLKIFIFKTFMGSKIRKELHGHGIGRHTDSEIWSIARGDLIAISEFLGKKTYMFGDQPSEVDCAVFGMLAMGVWQMRGSRHERLIYDELPNLVEYCERMKSKYWPHWDDMCLGLTKIER